MTCLSTQCTKCVCIYFGQSVQPTQTELPFLSENDEDDALTPITDLTITILNGFDVTDSRDIAAMTEKRHADLMRDIHGYEGVMATNATLRSLDFFIPSTYIDTKGETRPNRKCTRKGCDMIANK